MRNLRWRKDRQEGEGENREVPCLGSLKGVKWVVRCENQKAVRKDRIKKHPVTLCSDVQESG